MLSFLREMGYPFIIALTKCDKLNKTEFNARLEALETELAEYSDIVKIPCSSVKGDGIEAVKAEIEKVC
jgi:GTP-binding protein